MHHLRQVTEENKEKMAIPSVEDRQVRHSYLQVSIREYSCSANEVVCVRVTDRSNVGLIAFRTLFYVPLFSASMVSRWKGVSNE